MGEVMIIMVVAIVCAVFFAGWMYASNLVNTELTSIYSEDNATNISYFASQTYTYYNSGLSELKLMSAILIISFIVATFILAWYTSSHPLMFFVYLLISALFFIFSVYISNAYEDLMSNETLGTTFQGFTITNYLLLHLPTVIVVVTLIGTFLAIGGRYARGAEWT